MVGFTYPVVELPDVLPKGQCLFLEDFRWPNEL
jgi:hypothetical protein